MNEQKEKPAFTNAINKIGEGIYISLGLLCLFLAAAAVGFGLLYIVKSILGIDVFPGGHFWEVLFK